MIQRFGDDRTKFLAEYHPGKAGQFAADEERCYFGSAPYFYDINEAYGNGTSAMWFSAQLGVVNDESSATEKMDKNEIYNTAVYMSKEMRFYRITEALLFFFKFRCGAYGHFYRKVESEKIVSAMYRFMNERDGILLREESRRRDEERDRWRANSVTYEEYQRMKQAGEI